MKVAVIGSGISGLGAAYALQDTADVTVFEAEDRPGGHSCTIEVGLDHQTFGVDVGFIVYNPLNYPNLIGLFDALDVETIDSDMSFGLEGADGFIWASSARGLFARKRNLMRPRYIKFLLEILKFNDVARSALKNGTIGSLAFGHWFDAQGFSDDLKENYILPMAAAIWSTPEGRILDFPAKSFIEFFDNHRLMHKERPRWRTVKGGSRHYVKAIAARLGGRLRLNAPVERLRPGPEGKVWVHARGAAPAAYDEVVLACHSDTAHALLANAYPERAFPLASVRYQPNTVTLHTDDTLMPTRKAAWASWNVLKQPNGSLALSYWMNRLQDLPTDRNVFVSLNCDDRVADGACLWQGVFDHPVMDAPAEAAVRQIKRDNGADGIWLAGAWMGKGFHEDGLKAGLGAALALGGEVPWQAENIETYVPRRSAGASIKRQAGLQS